MYGVPVMFLYMIYVYIMYCLRLIKHTYCLNCAVKLYKCFTVAFCNARCSKCTESPMHNAISDLLTPPQYPLPSLFPHPFL